MTRRQTILFGVGATIAVLAIAVAVIQLKPMMTVSPPAAETTQSVSTNSVQIQNYMFTPTAIKVKVGDRVTWTNSDSVHHNIVADTISSDAPNGPLIGQGEKYSFQFTKAGTYTFHCMPHPSMHGTVIVTN